jgi:hypothetical protein
MVNNDALSQARQPCNKMQKDNITTTHSQPSHHTHSVHPTDSHLTTHFISPILIARKTHLQHTTWSHRQYQVRKSSKRFTTKNQAIISNTVKLSTAIFPLYTPASTNKLQTYCTATVLPPSTETNCQDAQRYRIYSSARTSTKMHHNGLSQMQHSNDRCTPLNNIVETAQLN